MGLNQCLTQEASKVKTRDTTKMVPWTICIRILILYRLILSELKLDEIKANKWQVNYTVEKKQNI